MKKPVSQWELKDYCKYLSKKKYKSSGEFKIKDNSIYCRASSKKLLDKIRIHFKWQKKKEVYTSAQALKMAKKFKSFKAWEKSVHYNKTQDKTFIINIMNWSRNYTFEICLNSAKKMKNIKEWHTKKRGFYDAAVRFGWMKRICTKKGWVYRKRRTIHSLITAAFNSKSINDLKRKDIESYNRIKENDWVKDIFEKTNLMKQVFLKEGLKKSTEIELNIFPATPLLKRKLVNNFWNMAA